MTPRGAAIEARDLTKTYPKDVRALDGLGFTVEAGSVFGLLGPNGAGKSTTVKVLTTLSRPDAGEARVAGHDVLRDPAVVRRAIGVVSQKHAVDEAATGRENLVLQGQIQGLRTSAARTRADELLDRFGLAEATTGLDPEVRADIWAEIAELSRSEGLTILLTTHYLEEADRLAARLAF